MAAPKAINYGTYKQILNQGKRVAVLPDVYYDTLPRALRRVAFTVSNVHRLSTIQDILTSLEKAEEKNMSFEEWVEKFDIDRFQQVSLGRMKTVFTTNMATQYNNGRLQVGLNSKRLTYLKYQAIRDDRTRPNHLANDGITRPINDDFWNTNTPPLGYGCRCFVLNISVEDLEDNPPTPAGELDDKSLNPDPGFNYNKRDPEKLFDTLFRQKAAQMPVSIRRAALSRFLEKGKDLRKWWDEEKKDFEK